MRRMLSLASVCCLVLGASVQAGQIENPDYKSWSRFKPGTSTTMALTTDAGGQATKMETKTTLAEVTPDKCVIEVASSMEAAGQKMDMPAQKIEVKKMIDVPDAPATPADKPAETPKADAKTSEESVTVPGGTFKAKVTQSTVDMAGSKTTSKVWTCDDVPGGVVKMESTTDGPMKAVTKSELKAFDKK